MNNFAIKFLRNNDMFAKCNYRAYENMNVKSDEL